MKEFQIMHNTSIELNQVLRINKCPIYLTNNFFHQIFLIYIFLTSKIKQLTIIITNGEKNVLFQLSLYYNIISDVNVNNHSIKYEYN